LLAFALVLTAWQAMLVLWGYTLDGGRRGLTEAIIIWLPQALALCFFAFGLSLKSSIEQAALYDAARQALGECAAETDGPPYQQDVEARPRGFRLSFKTYAMTKFLIEKGFDVNTRLVLHADGALPGVGGSVTVTPLHVALKEAPASRRRTKTD
jgi:hypothetical protein